VPQDDAFPYTIRVNSEIMESNGSSSMATVCGGEPRAHGRRTWPLVKPVAGIAMGMVKQGDKIVVLTDIQGSEGSQRRPGLQGRRLRSRHHGDWQLDCKVKGISFAVLAEALEQARPGPQHVLEKMLAVLAQPRDHHSPYAPRVERFNINPERSAW